MKKALKAIGGFFKRLDLFLYSFHVHGDRMAMPLFNLRIRRIYDEVEEFARLRLWPLGFEPAIEAYGEAIRTAKNLIGEEVWVDEEGCIWPGYIRGVPIRIASLNVAEQRGELACLRNAFIRIVAWTTKVSPLIFMSNRTRGITIRFLRCRTAFFSTVDGRIFSRCTARRLSRDSG